MVLFSSWIPGLRVFFLFFCVFFLFSDVKVDFSHGGPVFFLDSWTPCFFSLFFVFFFWFYCVYFLFFLNWYFQTFHMKDSFKYIYIYIYEQQKSISIIGRNGIPFWSARHTKFWGQHQLSNLQGFEIARGLRYLGDDVFRFGWRQLGILTKSGLVPGRISTHNDPSSRNWTHTRWIYLWIRMLILI